MEKKSNMFTGKMMNLGYGMDIFRFPYPVFQFYTTKHSKTGSEWESEQVGKRFKINSNADYYPPGETNNKTLKTPATDFSLV